MAPPSIPVPQYHTGAHYQDTEEESYYACSIASSNETADDLPGPGRTLGKFYSIAGRTLERRLARVAEKMGYGPRATFVRIHRQRVITASKRVESKYRAAPSYDLEYWKGELDQLVRLDQILRDGPSRLHDVNEDHYRLLRRHSSLLPSSSKEKDNLRKYCKQLIRYVRSNVESTKKQALDHIIELAFDDQHIRELLLGMDAVSVIKSFQSNPALWINCGASLQRSSRRALLVLGDAEVHTLALKFLQYEYSKDRAVCLEALAAYLQDPSYSFVAVRYLRQLSVTYMYDVLDLSVDAIAKAINANCGIVEFEECDRILDIWVSQNLSHGNRMDEHSAVMEVIFRYAEKLPRTVSSGYFHNWLLQLETGNTRTLGILHAHYIMAVLLMGIAAVNRSRDEDLRDTYSYQPLLSLVQSPPDLALSQFAFEEYDTMIGRVPGAEKLIHLCDKLTTFARSENSRIRERTSQCVKMLLVTDTYCRTAILKALSVAHISYPMDLFSFVVVEEHTFRSSLRSFTDPFFRPLRHWDAKGRLLHIVDRSNPCDGTRGCVVEHLMWFKRRRLLILRLGRGTAFSSAGHYPVFAGLTVNGERAYLAYAHLSDDYENVHCFITEGTKPEDLRIRTRKEWDDSIEERTPISVDVFVLRWPPDMYPENEDDIGLDATGPFSWKP